MRERVEAKSGAATTGVTHGDGRGGRVALDQPNPAQQTTGE